MENLGKYFLEQRLTREISYQQIFREIFIKEEHIRLLEENKLFDIGHYGFVKALVYNYARYLDVDVDAVMAEFKVMMPEHTKKEFTPRRALSEKKILLSTNFLWTCGIVVFALVLGSILWHSYQQGWLKTPELFKKEISSSSKRDNDKEIGEQKPDSLRLRMRALSETIPKTNTAADLANTQSILPDTTDFIGNILGDSPVNVQLH